MYKDFEQIMDMENIDCENSIMPNNCIDNMPLAMSYVPMQKWNKAYSNDVALQRGTIFPELDLPFLSRGEEV